MQGRQLGGNATMHSIPITDTTTIQANLVKMNTIENRNNSTMSATGCVNICANFQYAGVEYGNECYCGNNPPQFIDYYAIETKCNTKCSGTASTVGSCGGTWYMSLYTRNSTAPSFWTDFYQGTS